MKEQTRRYFLLSVALFSSSTLAQPHPPGVGVPIDPVTGSGTIVVPNPANPGGAGPNPPIYTPPVNMNCDTFVQGAKILSAADDPDILALRMDGLLSRGIVSRAISEEITNELKTGEHVFTQMVVFRQNGQPNLNTISNFLNDFQSLELRVELVKAGEAIERELFATVKPATEGEAAPEITRFTGEQLALVKDLAIKHLRNNRPLQDAAQSLLQARMMLKTDRDAMGMNPETVKKLKELKASNRPVTLKELVDAKLSPLGRMWFKIQLRKDWLNSTKLPSALLRSLTSKQAVSHEELFRLMGYNNLIGASNRNGELYTKIKTLLKQEQSSVINDLFASQQVRYELKRFSEQQIDVTQLITSLETLAQGSAPLVPPGGPKRESTFQSLNGLFSKKAATPPAATPGGSETPPASETAPDASNGSSSPATTSGGTYPGPNYYQSYSAVTGINPNPYGGYGYGYNYGVAATNVFPANKVVFEVTQQIAVDLFLLKDLAGVRVGVPGRFQQARNKLNLLKQEYIKIHEAYLEAKHSGNRAEVKRLKYELNHQKNLLMDQASDTQEYATNIVTSYMNWSLHANLDKGLLGNEIVNPIALPEPLRMSDPDLAKQWGEVYDEAFAIAVNPLYQNEVEPSVIASIKKVKDFFTKHNESMKKYWDTDFFDTPLGMKAKEESRKKFTDASKTLFGLIVAPGKAVSKDPLTQRVVNYTAWTAGATFIGMNSGTMWDWLQVFIKAAGGP